MQKWEEPTQARPIVHAAVGMSALLIVTLVLVPGMAEYSMWHDEVQAVRAADQLHSPIDVYRLEGFSARIVHPPLFFVLLKLWMLLVGQADFALRALSAFCGILTAALLYRTTV